VFTYLPTFLKNVFTYLPTYLTCIYLFNGCAYLLTDLLNLCLPYLTNVVTYLPIYLTCVYLLTKCFYLPTAETYISHHRFNVLFPLLRGFNGSQDATLRCCTILNTLPRQPSLFNSLFTHLNRVCLPLLCHPQPLTLHCDIKSLLLLGSICLSDLGLDSQGLTFAAIRHSVICSCLDMT
jgi:hypothetical protein